MHRQPTVTKQKTLAFYNKYAETITNKTDTHTLRPRDTPGAWPKFELGGLGVTSVCVNDAVKDGCEGDEVFIHWSQSWTILDNAVFSRSRQQKKVWRLGERCIKRETPM